MSLDLARISAYVDGELTEEERAEVEAWLEGSPEGRRLVEEERAVREGLRRLPPVEPRADFELRLRQRLRRESRPARWRFWLPLAAGLALVALWARGLPQVVALELVRDHHACFGKAELPARVWSSHADQVQRWFAGQGTEVPRLPESVAGLSLVGARYCPLPGFEMAPHLYYSSGDDELSVFVVGRSVRLNGGFGAMVRQTAVRLLPVAGHTIGVVAEDPAAVEAFRRALEVTRADLTRQRGRARILTAPGSTASLLTSDPSGAVAQLGARVNGIHEVMGSIPISSTNPLNN